MTKEQMFDAFGQIDAAYILAVDDILTKTSQKTSPPARGRLFRTALLVAVIAGLLALSAYAAGLFGIFERLIEASAPSVQSGTLSPEAEEMLDSLHAVNHRDYISLSGVCGSPEYSAAAEWLDFKGSYADRKAAEQLQQSKPYYEWRDLERSFAPDARTKEICRLYEVWDADMWEKLQEICAKYELSLHTERTLLPGSWNQQRKYGQYEDGSFLAAVTTTLEDQFYFYDIYLERNGALPCDDMTASCADEYEEWAYKNAHGQQVSIAMMDTSPADTWEDVSYLVFFTGEDATITVKAQHGHNAGEGDDRLFAQALADSIDFSAAASAQSPEDALEILKGD